MCQSENRIVTLRGQKVILRPPNKATDLDSFWRWINDSETTQFLSVYLPITRQQEEEWFDRLGSQASDIVFAIETLDGSLIGVMGLHNIDWRSRVATTGAIIGEKSCRGKGYGTDAKMILLNYAFNTLNLHKICSSVIDFNDKSVSYSLGCGYQPDGRRKQQIFKCGKYHDEIMLAIFRDGWLPIWERYCQTGSVKP